MSFKDMLKSLQESKNDEEKEDMKNLMAVLELQNLREELWEARTHVERIRSSVSDLAQHAVDILENENVQLRYIHAFVEASEPHKGGINTSTSMGGSYDEVLMMIRSIVHAVAINAESTDAQVLLDIATQDKYDHTPTSEE